LDDGDNDIVRWLAYLRKYEYPVLARLWRAEDCAEDALGLLERALPQ